MKYVIRRKGWEFFLKRRSFFGKEREISYETIYIFNLATFLWAMFWISLVIFLARMKYKACMEIFDSFWYCATR